MCRESLFRILKHWFYMMGLWHLFFRNEKHCFRFTALKLTNLSPIFSGFSSIDVVFSMTSPFNAWPQCFYGRLIYLHAGGIFWATSVVHAPPGAVATIKHALRKGFTTERGSEITALPRPQVASTLTPTNGASKRVTASVCFTSGRIKAAFFNLSSNLKTKQSDSIFFLIRSPKY